MSLVLKVSMWLWLWLLLTFSGATNASGPEDPHLESVKEIFAWVNDAENGFVSSKQSVRRMVEHDVDTPLIVYATQDIRKDELLVQTPWSHILSSDDPKGDDEKGWYCGTAQKLAKEMIRGRDSFYAPYVTYINDEPNGQLPTAYSHKAKKLLYKVLNVHTEERDRSIVYNRDQASNQRLMPERIAAALDMNWYLACGENRNDPVGAKAASMVIQRADDHILIPAYDAYNHRNNDLHNDKEYMNARTETTHGKYHQTFALRDIAKGEQIFISYNMCEQCGGRADYGYGTPEMYRDYGFVEWFPQRWHYPGFGDYDEYENDMELNQFDLYKNENTGDLTISWTHLTEDENKLERFEFFLGYEIRRLNRLKNIEWASMYSWTEEEWTKSGISGYEWSNINQFVDAHIVAMALALEDLSFEDETEEDKNIPLTLKKNIWEQYVHENTHYDTLSESEMDYLGYFKQTCDNSEFHKFRGYIDTEVFSTDRHQMLAFFESYLYNVQPEEVNVCMEIDNSVQMCTNYRPYHHEYMTHVSARYIEKLKRVAIIGNGDSMLLHEVMKYGDKDLELVVNIELDQMVTRKAFRHFKTDPYFHDPRVDWWFGDVMDSVLMLPDSYWGSFDMVLIELSEQFMSKQVTDDLDLISALSKLLNPITGVIVKNGLYSFEMAEKFDHAMELFYEAPAVCSETVALGSNVVNFFSAPIYDHGIADMDNILYKAHPSEGKNDRHHMVHDYRNKASREACTDEESEEDDEKDEGQTIANGVLELVTLEKISTPKKSFKLLANAIKAFIEGVGGFTILEDGMSYQETPQTALVVMEEGYVAARVQESEDANSEEFSVAMDIYLWSKTHRIQELKDTFRMAYGSKLVSSHKIVVGGIFGTKNWKDDAKHIGPGSISKSVTCKSDSENSNNTLEEVTIGKIAIEEAIALTNARSAVVAIFCGKEADPCPGFEAVKGLDSVLEAIPIYDCSGDDVQTQYECERSIIEDLSARLGSSTKKKKLSMIAFDARASSELYEIANSLFDTHNNRAKFLAPHTITMTWPAAVVSNGMTSAPWRSGFLDRFRKQIHFDPVKLGEFVVAGQYGFGIVSTNDPEINTRLDSFRYKVESRLDGAKVELRNVFGGLYNYIHMHNHISYSEKDYEKSAATTHFEEQVPLARQTILQYEGSKQMKEQIANGGTSMDCNFAEKLIYGSVIASIPEDLKSQKLLEDPDTQVLFRYPVGEGCVVRMQGRSLDAIAIWDGKDYLTINLFEHDSLYEAKSMVEAFDAVLKGFAPYVLVDTDSQPRGLGRVVNFPEEPIDRVALGGDLMFGSSETNTDYEEKEIGYDGDEL